MADPDFQASDPRRFDAALRRFDAENGLDPNLEPTPDGPRPREHIYAHWLTEWVLRLCPEASEPLRLAARCQHLCRWQVPRNSQPMTRAGYLKWRAELKKFHARKAGEILRELGYPETVIARVQSLNLKENLPQDPECQIIEDALCLVFLEHQFADLAAKSSDEKMIGVLRKTWNKMSAKGQMAAQTLTYGRHEQKLLDQALAQPES